MTGEVILDLFVRLTRYKRYQKVRIFVFFEASGFLFLRGTLG
jgi:hypothetical protein